MIPVEWPPSQEQVFLRWWSGFARRMGFSQHPDHDKHTHDWRGLWWLGFRGFARQGLRHDVRYAPNLRRAKTGNPRRFVAPSEEKVFGIVRTR